MGVVFRPVASVLLESKSKKFEALMYIDSGADITTIPLEAGSALGFKQSSMDRILEMRGVSGGGVPYLIKSIRLGFDGLRIKVRIAWTLIEEVPFLLGRLDVFNKFDITFQERKGLILFSPPTDFSRSFLDSRGALKGASTRDLLAARRKERTKRDS